MRSLIILWQFSRPHTVIGSTLSISALYLIAAHDADVLSALWWLWLPSLMSALACNIYITGLNQWSDVEVDQINKPWLPIPAGRLTREQALRIVLTCGILSLVFAAFFSVAFFILLLLIIGIGTAYSLPPLKFKRHHVTAAAAITLVRGLLVNIGFYLHFHYELTGIFSLASQIIPLTIFVMAFSLGIAWFKDIPDTEGDKAYDFGTLAVRSGRYRAFLSGVVVVTFAYLWIITSAWFGQLPASSFFIITHCLALFIFLWQARRLQVGNDKQVKRFYMFFWGLFFLEYILYPIGFYL